MASRITFPYMLVYIIWLNCHVVTSYVLSIVNNVTNLLSLWSKLVEKTGEGIG